MTSTNSRPDDTEEENATTSALGLVQCPYCLSDIAAADEIKRCPSCRSAYHADCWKENGGCGVYGCSQVPAVETRRAVEVPQAYWGQENKPCPSCSQQILAAAMRCRHCGVTFASARPQDTDEFQSRMTTAARLPGLRRQIIVIFVLSVIPVTAPVAAIAGLVWRRAHEDELRALPPLHVALSKIALIVATVSTTALAVMTAVYSATHSKF